MTPERLRDTAREAILRGLGHQHRDAAFKAWLAIADAPDGTSEVAIIMAALARVDAEARQEEREACALARLRAVLAPVREALTVLPPLPWWRNIHAQVYGADDPGGRYAPFECLTDETAKALCALVNALPALLEIAGLEGEK